MILKQLSHCERPGDIYIINALEISSHGGYRRKRIVWRSEAEIQSQQKPQGPHIELQCCSGLSPIRTRPLLPYSDQSLGDLSPGKGQGFGGRWLPSTKPVPKKKWQPGEVLWLLRNILVLKPQLGTSYLCTSVLTTDPQTTDGNSSARRLFWLRIPAQRGECPVRDWGTWPSHQWVKWFLCLVRWSLWVSSQTSENTCLAQKNSKNSWPYNVNILWHQVPGTQFVLHAVESDLDQVFQRALSLILQSS